MAFSDSIYLIITAFVLIIGTLTISYIYDAVMPSISGDLPVGYVAKSDAAMDNNINFINLSFAALFFLFAILSFVFSSMVASNPVFLIAWLLINMITLFMYDTLLTVLDAFMLSDLNTGVMNTAYAFFTGGMAKGIIIINIIISIALYGKGFFK